MKKILVTGSSGFLGVHLCNALCNMGHEVTGIDRSLNGINSCSKIHKNYSFILGDIRKLAFHREYDVVYHLAALTSIPESFDYSEEFISTNVWGTANICKSFPNSRIVFASSFAAGENKSPYGISKKAAEHFVNTHRNSVSIRFGNVFGEGQVDEEKVIPAFCKAIKHGKKAMIFGDGSMKRDFVYVHDMVDEIIRIGESHIKGQTDTGYGDNISILQLYRVLCRLAKGKENYRLYPNRPGDTKFPRTKYPIKEPHYGFSLGLRRTLTYYLDKEGF